jgi:hypothetical protein
MRAVIVLTAATLSCIAPAYAGPTAREAHPPTPTDQRHRLSDMELEEHAEKAAERQDVRDKKFDDSIKKATGSICAGCLTSSPPTWALERPKRPARPFSAAQ